MPLLDQIREDKLIELARARFDPDLSDAELQVLHHSACSANQPLPAPDAPRPVVRAPFLRWLASDPDAAPHIDSQGLRVYSATLTGDFDLRDCRIPARLVLCCCTVQQLLNLRAAKTSGVFIFMSFLADGLDADRATMQGALFLRATQSRGQISLIGTVIEGELDCAGTKLGFNTIALLADRAKIAGDVFLNQGFESAGQIRLSNASIAGNLECDGARLTSQETALCADGATITGSIFLRGGFESNGEISLIDAGVAGQLSFTGAALRATGDALSADRAKIIGNVFLHQGFASAGRVRFPGAIIGGDLAIRGARVAQVNCQNAVVAGNFFWQGIQNPEAASLFLTGAKVKGLHDDRESWPPAGKLHLTGLVYEELALHRRPSPEEVRLSVLAEELPLRVGDRIQWLMRQPTAELDEAQPWDALSHALQNQGESAAARHVIFRHRCQVARRLSLPLRSFAIALAWLRENPVRIYYSYAPVLVFGTLIFATAARSGAMIESDQAKLDQAKPDSSSPQSNPHPTLNHYPPFQPFIYTLENSVPVFKFGMDDKWTPDPAHKPQPWFPGVGWLGWLAVLNSYRFLAWTRWMLIVWGWLQTLVLPRWLAEQLTK